MCLFLFFFQAEDGIRDKLVTGVQTCALPIYHFDLPSLRLLENHHTSVVTASRTSDLLRPRRYREVREMKWGERARVGAAELRAIEVNHWGARVRTDHYRGYNGYVIDVGRYRILFACDT